MWPRTLASGQVSAAAQLISVEPLFGELGEIDLIALPCVWCSQRSGLAGPARRAGGRLLDGRAWDEFPVAGEAMARGRDQRLLTG